VQIIKQSCRKVLRSGLFALSAIVGAASHSHASTITYTITDIVTNSDPSATFTGTGFAGIYPSFPNDFGPQGPSFTHIFGLEYYGGIYSETELQVDVNALAGQTINSATLSFVLRDGSPGSQMVTVTSYDSSGTLEYHETPFGPLGTTSFTSTSYGANSVDVTSLLQSRISAGGTWFGLYLTPNGPDQSFQWTYTDSNVDAAEVRLTVDFGNNVPEPGSFVLLGTFVISAGGLAWFKKGTVKAVAG